MGITTASTIAETHFIFAPHGGALRDLICDGVDDATLALAVQGALKKKYFKHGGHEGGYDDLKKDAHNNRPMITIDG